MQEIQLSKQQRYYRKHKQQCKRATKLWEHTLRGKQSRAKSQRKQIAKHIGLTLEQYELMLKFPCQICGNKYKRMAVDHNHKTNKVRGTLCYNCNTGIGMFKDNITIMNEAIVYLIRGRNEPRGPD